VKKEFTSILKGYDKKRESLLLWGSLLILLGLASSLGAYYTYSMTFRYVAFYLLSLGILTLFIAMKEDIEEEVKSSLFSVMITIGLVLLYIVLRMQLHRFDFGVGDASDYYVAGVCSVTYSQDIGFFLPLSASISALGYSVFGVSYDNSYKLFPASKDGSQCMDKFFYDTFYYYKSFKYMVLKNIIF